MINRLRSHISYANVVSTMCLFILLGGGAYAAVKLPKNSVGTKQLKKNSVRSKKVKDHTLLASDAKPGQFATPANLVGLDAGKLGGIEPGGYVHGAGKLLSAEFTGTSHLGNDRFVPVPGGAYIALICDDSGYGTFLERSGGDTHTYDRFTTDLVSGANPTVHYVKFSPSTIELIPIHTDDQQRTYDVSSSAGYAHVVVFGHFDNSSKVCTVKARGWSSP
jgi:hypothetical protein